MIRKQRRGEQDGDAAGGEEQDTLGPPDPRHDDPHQRRADHRAEGHAEKDAARRALVEAVALNEIRPGPEPGHGVERPVHAEEPCGYAPIGAAADDAEHGFTQGRGGVFAGSDGNPCRGVPGLFGAVAYPQPCGAGHKHGRRRSREHTAAPAHGLREQHERIGGEEHTARAEGKDQARAEGVPCRREPVQDHPQGGHEDHAHADADEHAAGRRRRYRAGKGEQERPRRPDEEERGDGVARTPAVRKDARRDLHEPVWVKIGGAHDRHEPAADGEFAHDVHGEGARGCPKETDERIADGQNGKNKPCMSGHGFG